LQALPDAVLDQQQPKQQQEAAAAVAGVQPLHHAELSAGGKGLVTPWALHRLLQLLQDTQCAAGFDAFMDTEPSSSSLNLLQPTWQQARQAAAAAAAGLDPAAAAAVAGAAAGAGDRVAQQQQQWQAAGRGLSAEEQQAWEPSRQLLQGRVLRQLRLSAGGELAARLG
jgi:hypothetical protein